MRASQNAQLQARERQRTLPPDRISAFYHDVFVTDQLKHFLDLVPPGSFENGVVIDVGGGCGYFANALASAAAQRVRVLDSDPKSIDACRVAGVPAVLGDALNPEFQGDEQVACFNLILHHLVASAEGATRDLQSRALSVWAGRVRHLFVNEYIYESYISGWSGSLIFRITKSRILSMMGRLVAAVVPSLRANTFGVGVRFRSHDEWMALFRSAGFDVDACRRGNEEHISLPLRLLFIRSIRRDSFLLRERRAV